MWNPSTCDCECIKACKIEECLDNKNCSCKKHLFRKLALAREDEILNTTEILLDVKKVTCEKNNNCLIHTISLMIICLLLLVVVFLSCCFYYTKN